MLSKRAFWNACASVSFAIGSNTGQVLFALGSHHKVSRCCYRRKIRNTDKITGLVNFLKRAPTIFFMESLMIFLNQEEID